MYSVNRKDQYKKAPFKVPIAKFGCDNCGRRWQSVNGSLGDYQACKCCYQKCYPREFRWQEPNKRGNQNQETYLSHDSDLCGKCIRLGYSCIEALGDEQPADGDIRVSNNEGNEITLERSVNIFSNLVIDDRLNAKKTKKANSKKGKKFQHEKEKQEWMAPVDAEKQKNGPDNNKRNNELILTSSNKKEVEKEVNKDDETPASITTEQQMEGLRVSDSSINNISDISVEEANINKTKDDGDSASTTTDRKSTIDDIDTIDNTQQQEPIKSKEDHNDELVIADTAAEKEDNNYEKKGCGDVEKKRLCQDNLFDRGKGNNDQVNNEVNN